MAEKKNSEIVVVDESTGAVIQQANPDNVFSDINTAYSTIKPTNFKERIEMAKLVQGKTENLSDHLNEKIDVVDIFAHKSHMRDKQTGELVPALRVVLIAKDKKTYASVSSGVINSIQNILSIVGDPNVTGAWEEPIPVMAVAEKTSNKNTVVKLILA